MAKTVSEKRFKAEEKMKEHWAELFNAKCDEYEKLQKDFERLAVLYARSQLEKTS